jgi:hypothetical protein
MSELEGKRGYGDTIGRGCDRRNHGVSRASGEWTVRVVEVVVTEHGK